MSKEYIGREEVILAVRHAWAKGLNRRNTSSKSLPPMLPRCGADGGSKRMAYRFARNAAKNMNGKITERCTAIPAEQG